MNKEIIRQFREEFGIHFSKSELQFAIAFLEDALTQAKQEGREERDKEIDRIIDNAVQQWEATSEDMDEINSVAFIVNYIRNSLTK